MKVCLSFCAISNYKSVTLYDIPRVFVGGKGGFLNLGNVEQSGAEVPENPCFCWKSFVDDAFTET